MRKTTILCVLAAFALVFAAADGAATEPATLVVDGDGVQCASADFSSIQAAVDAAQPGDLIRVCPDLYSESVVVDKPLTLRADPDAVEAIDCFQPTLPELPTDQQAILDPAGEGFSIAFKLEADDVELAGFVVQGASVGIDASDSFSGYRVHHNLLRLNTLFASDFGSEGTRQSRADHNCIRENQFGLVSELDDDSLWPENRGPENARDLHSARIDHNDTTGNIEGIATAGPGERVDVTIDHNRSRGDQVGIGFQNSTGSAIVENEITSAASSSIIVGGGNDGLEIRSNLVRPGRTGVLILRLGFLDVFPASRNVVLTQNDLRSDGIVVAVGIFPQPGSLLDSTISENTVSGFRGNGMFLFTGNTGNMFRDNHFDNNAVNGISVGSGATGNTFRGNHSDNNGRNGIVAGLGATGNTFEQNSMHGNALFDANDLNTPLNVWTGNDCDTDFPAGMICGVG
jgi:Right handed beta helix region